MKLMNDAVPLGRPPSSYRRKAALWLASAASFRQCAAAGGGVFGTPHAKAMARAGVAMATANRKTSEATHG